MNNESNQFGSIIAVMGTPEIEEVRSEREQDVTATDCGGKPQPLF
jgi:hypothetical protein